MDAPWLEQKWKNVIILSVSVCSILIIISLLIMASITTARQTLINYFKTTNNYFIIIIIKNCCYCCCCCSEQTDVTQRSNNHPFSAQRQLQRDWINAKGLGRIKRRRSLRQDLRWLGRLQLLRLLGYFRSVCNVCIGGYFALGRLGRCMTQMSDLY